MPASGGGGAPAAGSGAGAVVASAAVFALLLAMTWDALSGCWDMVLENKGPFVLVVLGMLIVWLNTRNGDGSSSLAASPAGPGASGRAQLPAQLPRRRGDPASLPPADGGSGGGSGAGSAAGRLQREGSGGGRSGKTMTLQCEDSTSGLGTAAGASGLVHRRSRKAQSSKRGLLMEMVNLSASAGAVSGSGRGGGSTALVPASDMSGALANTSSLRCFKPVGCGFRHACPDLGRRWIHCDKHGWHRLPSDGSVWREVVPEGQPLAGSLRLCLAWEGQVLDVTAIGHCRGWDRELTAVVGARLDSGRRVAGMCSKSPAFPMLDKWQEVCAMDYAAAARGRRLWALFQRWLRGRAGACRPLALEMGQRSGA